MALQVAGLNTLQQGELKRFFKDKVDVKDAARYFRVDESVILNFYEFFDSGMNKVEFVEARHAEPIELDDPEDPEDEDPEDEDDE